MAEPRYVFIIKGEPPLVLHPFGPDSGVFRDPAAQSVEGRYGAGEAPANVLAVRTELYRSMEKGARRHFLDRGWYWRVALSAGIFLSVYLFFSIVVRDPIPLVDELLLGGFAAAAAFYASERRALSVPGHIDSVMTLRKALDAAFFTESRVVDLVESWRDEALALGPSAYYRLHAAGEAVTLSEGERSEALELCEYFSRRWRSKSVVAELYRQSIRGVPVGQLLDRADRTLGRAEAALAIAYIRLLSVLPREER